MNVLKKILGVGLAVVAAFTVSAQSAMNLANVPLWFENGADGQFVAHGRDAQFSVSSAGAGFILQKSDGHTAAVNIRFVNANAPEVSGQTKLTGKLNYFTGNQAADWRTSVPIYSKVALNNIYSGVDAIFYGNQQALEYDLNVAPQANSGAIAMRFEGATKLSVNPEGELVVGLNGGEIIQHHPIAYQTDASGLRHEVKADYALADATTVKFTVGDYDHSRPLVIDPILGYSTYFGGNFGDIGWAIALGPNGTIYVAGQTFSTVISNKTTVIPFSQNALYPTNSGGKYEGDAFIAKFDSTGQTLDFCTYLGGSGDDAAYALAVDASGNAYIAGGTDSTNFPTTNWVTTATYSGRHISGVRDSIVHSFPGDAFVTELAADGSHLIYSTYLGGESTEVAYGLAIDGSGNAYVAGLTFSTNFPTAGSNPLFRTLQCTNSYDVNANAFVSEIAAGGNTLNYSTYLGGTNYDVARAISYNSGFVYVAGYTFSTNFPFVAGLTNCLILNNFTNSKSRIDKSSDAFVTTFVTDGTDLDLKYSTFLGSTNDDVATGIVGDGVGNAYVVGWSTSTNFPSLNPITNLTSFVRTNTSGFVIATNAFLTQMLWTNTTGATNLLLQYSQLFGGRGLDVASGVAMDAAGNVFVVGSAQSTNFPTFDIPTNSELTGGLRTTNSSRVNSHLSRSDVFVTAFQAGLTNLLYSTYLGGSRDDFGNGIAVDGATNVFITGQTLSTNFPPYFPPFPSGLTNAVVDNGLLRNRLVGTNDAFVAEILYNSVRPNVVLKLQLSIFQSAANVVVAWPVNASGVTPDAHPLETTTENATGWNTAWTTVTNVPATNDGLYQYYFNPTNPTQFFRFRSH